MKRQFILALIGCMLLCGCQAGGAETTTTPADLPETTGSALPETTAPAESTAQEGFTFTYNGTQIALHAPAAPIVEALGEPKKYTESGSCAFDGIDKTYFYGSFYLETYPMEDVDFVFGWWFADDTVSTPEGIFIGAPQAQVEAAYGADAFNGSNAYIITRGDGTLTVILEDGLVSSIQYAIIVQ